MLSFLQDFIPSWSSTTTATRLVDACQAHLERKKQELATAETKTDTLERAASKADDLTASCERNLFESEKVLQSCVAAQESRLKSLAKAIMTVRGSTEEDNIETLRQVLDMAHGCCSEAFMEEVQIARKRIEESKERLKQSVREASQAHTALRVSKEDKATLIKQMREIETIRDRLEQPPPVTVVGQQHHEKVQ